MFLLLSRLLLFSFLSCADSASSSISQRGAIDDVGSLLSAATSDARSPCDPSAHASAVRAWSLAASASNPAPHARAMTAVLAAKGGGDQSSALDAVVAAADADDGGWVISAWAVGAWELAARRALSVGLGFASGTNRSGRARSVTLLDSTPPAPKSAAYFALTRVRSLCDTALSGRSKWLRMWDCADGVARVDQGSACAEDDAVAACRRGAPAAERAYPLVRHAVPLSSLLRSCVNGDLWLGLEAAARRRLALHAAAVPWDVDGWSRPLRPRASVTGATLIPFHDGARSGLRGGSPCFAALLTALESVLPTARVEFESLRGGALANETAGLADGKWTHLLLLKDGAPARGCPLAPSTCAAVRALPLSAVRDGQAKFSVLHAGARIRAHAGPTADRLRVHCTIKLFRRGASAATFRVGTATRHWHEGECFVFDEAIEHEVVTDTAADSDDSDERVVLLVDIVNPFLARDDDWRGSAAPDAHLLPALDGLRKDVIESACWKK